MKPRLLLAIILLLASVTLATFSTFAQEHRQPTPALDVNDTPFSAPAAATPAPLIVYLPAPAGAATPEAFTRSALGWIQAATVVGLAAIGLVGMLWTKLHDVVKRQDRQAEKTGSLQEQVTSLAKDTPAPESPPK